MNVKTRIAQLSLGAALLASPAFASTISGRALEFDGTDDQVVVPYDVSLGNTHELTVEAWIFPHDTSGGGLVSMWGTGVAQDRYLLMLANGDVYARIVRSSDGGSLQITAPIPAFVWSHVAMSYDGITLRLFVNGVLANSLAFPGEMFPLPLNVRFGIEDMSATSVPEFYDGLLDEVRIWRNARSIQEIFEYHNHVVAPGTNGLVGNWHFNEPAAQQQVNDATSAINHGSLGIDMAAAGDDPIRVASGAALRWENVEKGLTGSTTPYLYGVGSLLPATPVSLHLRNANPGAPSFLIVGTSLLGADFLGGTLVPTPNQFFGGLLTSPTGEMDLAGLWPPGVPACQDFYFQMWIADAAGPAGFSATNGLRGQTP
jgi:hypothetical protein